MAVCAITQIIDTLCAKHNQHVIGTISIDQYLVTIHYYLTYTTAKIMRVIQCLGNEGYFTVLQLPDI